MIEFLEIISNGDIKEPIDAIRADPNTEYVNCNIFDKHRASCMIITRNSPVCRALSSTESFCKNCPLTLDRPPETPVRWQVMFSGSSSLNRFISKVKSKGITATPTEVGDPKKNRLLTFEQEQVIAIAEERGYFEFPRRIGLQGLSGILKVCPSTLDEVLRRAEGKIIANHITKPNGTPSHKAS